MKYFNLFLWVSLIILMMPACGGKSAEAIVFDQQTTKPVLLLPNKPSNIEGKAAELFKDIYKKVTGESIQVISESQAEQAFPHIISLGNTTLFKKANIETIKTPESFGLSNAKNVTCIYGSSDVGLLYGVTGFFSKYVGSMYADSAELITPNRKKILLPESIRYAEKPAFVYREAYFRQAADYDYCLWNRTHKLEEFWGSWGHNLHRLIKEASGSPTGPSSCYALHNGQRNPDQYCFTSADLYQLLVKGIQRKLIQVPDARYFAILPNDNLVVCSCDACRAAGNTAKDAAPALATLITKLASRFPELVFMMSSYGCTRSAPKQKMPLNSGVIISTIDYPKGIPIQKSAMAAQFQNLISDWKRKTNHVFIWDYVVQYSNYFDLFPVMKSFQDNLKWYQTLGVTGIFAHGSEEHYSIFDEVKSFVISSLLWNPNQNLDSLRYAVIENTYPENFESVNEYYDLAERAAYQAGKSLDIYGNISLAASIYMNPEKLDIFLYDIAEQLKVVKGNLKTRLARLQTALYFDKLENMRLSGVSEQGYAAIQKNGTWMIHPSVQPILDEFAAMMQASALTVFQERGMDLANYLRNWKEYIVNYSYNNLWFSKPVKIISASDEDFVKRAPKMLTDGAMGFEEYTMHWLLQSTEDLVLEMNIPDGLSKPNLQVSLLNDPRHGILFPESIQVGVIGQTEGVQLPIPGIWDDAVTKHDFVLHLPAQLKGNIQIRLVRRRQNADGDLLVKSSIACDEICLN